MSWGYKLSPNNPDNKVIVTDERGNEILNAEDRKIATDMLKAEFKRGANTELARINTIMDRVIKHFEKLSEKAKTNQTAADAEVSRDIVKMLRDQINA